MKPNHSMSAGRLWAAYNYPYLSAALFAIRFIDDSRVRAISGDEYFRLYFDGRQLGDWSPELLGIEMVHQVNHLLRAHSSRAREINLREADTFRWVDAVDAEINDDLLEGHPLPRDSATAEELGLSAALFGEEYFLGGKPRNMELRDCGSSAHGRPRDWNLPPPTSGKEGVRPDEIDLIRRQVAAETVAYQKVHGTVPGNMLRWATGLLDPQIDWRVQLRALLRRGFAEVAGAVDYDYRRPSRRSSCTSKVVLPSLRSRVPRVAIVLDTSASMDEYLLGQALQEIDGLLSAGGVRFGSIEIFTCDVEAQIAQRVRRASDLKLFGGGGTDLRAGIDKALESRHNPDLLIVISDGFTEWPENSSPKTKFLVVLLGENAPDAPSWMESVSVARA